MKAIVPDKPVGEHYEPRSDGKEGVMCRNIQKALPNEMNKCGIYEWQARGLFIGRPDGMVVYVGSTFVEGDPEPCEIEFSIIATTDPTNQQL